MHEQFHTDATFNAVAGRFLITYHLWILQEHYVCLHRKIIQGRFRK